MGALKKIEPQTSDRNALKEFLQHQQGLSQPMATLLAHFAESEEPTFVFFGKSEFSTQEAADLLNVSRPFLIGLLNEGLIAFRKVGKHRRVNAASLLTYKVKQEEENKRITDALTRIAENQDMGY